MSFHPKVTDKSLAPGTVAVVTGANAGIGYETAKRLAVMGARVILACRSQQRATKAVARMKREVSSMENTPRHPDDLDLEVMPLDLGSLQSTMEFIKKVKDAQPRIHILVCNAGILPGKLEITEDGYERMFQVNYLSHFLLVAHLLPVMKQSGEDCRIVFVSSEAYKWAGSFDLSTSRGGNWYDPFRFYAKSKAYQLQHMLKLSSLLRGSHMTILGVHPGYVLTDLTRETNGTWHYRLFRAIFSWLGWVKTVEGGAAIVVEAAVSTRWRGVAGVYLADCQERAMSGDVRNPKHQQALWEFSLHCLQDLLPEDVLQHQQPLAQ